AHKVCDAGTAREPCMKLQLSRWVVALALMTAVSCTAATPAELPDHIASITSEQPTLAPGVHLILGGFVAGRQPDGNSVIFSGKDGLVVVDTGRHATQSDAILAYAAQQHRSVAAVINSHWHLDHVSGNSRLRAIFPHLVVYASSAIEAAMSGFLADSRESGKQFLSQSGDPGQQADVRADIATIDSGKALFPDVKVVRSGLRTVAGRPLQIGYAAWSVTAGDLWVYDPASHILVAGDLVTLPAPFFDTACPRHWKTALAELDKVKFATLVPGHGMPMSHTQFSEYRRGFVRLLACAESTAPKAQCIEAWVVDAAAWLSDESNRKLARGLLDYYIDGVLRGDPAKQASLCGG
ncbi:MAG: MBL fold metallo-hydrolase, partial [Tahibacter sp.]